MYPRLGRSGESLVCNRWDRFIPNRGELTGRPYQTIVHGLSLASQVFTKTGSFAHFLSSGRPVGLSSPAFF